MPKIRKSFFSLIVQFKEIRIVGLVNGINVTGVGALIASQGTHPGKPKDRNQSMKSTSLLLSLVSLTLVSPVMALETLAKWTFEVSVPTGAGPHAAEVGSGNASGFHASAATVFSNPVGNGSAESFSANTWAIGDYWQFQTSASGFKDISLSWDQTSSSTGPRDFGLYYSTDGSAFTQFGADYIVLVNGAPNTAWSSGTTQNAFAFLRDLSSVTGLNNAATIYFRLLVETTTSANQTTPGTIASGGTSRIDNFTISANRIPTTNGRVPDALPLGFVMVTLLGLLLCASGRRVPVLKPVSIRRRKP